MPASRDLLTVDCGNSTIRVLRHADGTAWSTPTASPDLVALAGLARAASRVVVVSVVPAALAAARAALVAEGRQVAVVGVDIPCPLRLDYATVETLGADRWLGAYAAHRRFGAAITVDCGTATTVNVVDAAGVFRGGAIAPGLSAFVAGMRATAPALPAADLDAVPTMPGASTQGSVDAGVLLGWAGLVERLVTEARGAAGPAATLVVTGGNAERLSRLSRLEAIHVPNLLHDGMALLGGESPCDS